MSLSMKHGLASLVSLVAVLALAPAARAQEPVPGDQEAPEEPLFETIERPLADGLTLTADHYRTRHVTPGPVIVAFHMEDSSRAEFRDIAKGFLDYNGSVLAVDLRAGKEAKGVANATAAAFEAKNKRPATPAEAYADVVEAVAWARELHEGAKVVLLGSGYSAALALVYAAREPEGCDAVIAFSPGEVIEGWTVAAEARGVKVPVYVSCGNGLEEKSRTTRVFNALDKKLRASFYPPDGLVAPRGALQLEQSDVNAHRRVWNGVYAILKPLAPAAPAAPAGG